MRDKNLIIICALICATLIICGVLFWPTLYKYDKILGKLPVRINRLTGYTEILTPSGWERKVSDNETKAIPKEEIDKIETRGDFDGKGHYKFVVYNGSDWTIKIIKLSIGLKDGKDKIIWQRKYETMVNIRPFSNSSDSIEMIDYAPKTYSYFRLIDPLDEPAKESTSKKMKFEPYDESKIIRPEVRLEGALGYKSE